MAKKKAGSDKPAAKSKSNSKPTALVAKPTKAMVGKRDDLGQPGGRRKSALIGCEGCWADGPQLSSAAA